MIKHFKCGAAVEVQGFDMKFRETWESGRITRWTKSMGPRSALPAGYHPVRFESDGGVLMVHETSMRLRAAEGAGK